MNKLRINRQEGIAFLLALVLFGLLIGTLWAHNETINDLQKCRQDQQQKNFIQCGPKLVNAPGQYDNISMLRNLSILGHYDDIRIFEGYDNATTS